MTASVESRLPARSRERRRQAHGIMASLGLLECWSRYGRPVVVGAVAHDLALGPDIDLEVYCPALAIEDGFAVLGQVARHSGVVETLFQNHLHGPDGALYWRIGYRDEDETDWKIDMWSAPENYPLPRGEDLVVPLAQAMTPERRMAILRLKDWRDTSGTVLLSIDIYRAVVDGGVRDPEGMTDWMAHHETGVLTAWQPGRTDDGVRRVS